MLELELLLSVAFVLLLELSASILDFLALLVEEEEDGGPSAQPVSDLALLTFTFLACCCLSIVLDLSTVGETADKLPVGFSADSFVLATAGEGAGEPDDLPVSSLSLCLADLGVSVLLLIGAVDALLLVGVLAELVDADRAALALLLASEARDELLVLSLSLLEAWCLSAVG